MLVSVCIMWLLFVVFKQKTAYDMRISDWSSDVCSSDLVSSYDLEARHDRIYIKTQASITVEDLKQSIKRILDASPQIKDKLSNLRSEERSVGKECVSTCRSRWSTYH